MRQNILKLLLLTFITFTLSNCEKEEVISNDKNLTFFEKLEVKKNTADLFSNFYFKDKITINWDKYNTYNLDTGTFFEFKVTPNSPLENDFPTIFKEAPSFSIIAFEANDEIKLSLVEYMPFVSSTKLTSSLFNLNGFSGSVRYFNQNGNLENKQLYLDGNLRKTDFEDLIPIPFKEINDKVTSRVEPCIPVLSTLDVYETTHHVIDWYTGIINESTGQMEYTFSHTQYLYSETVHHTYEYFSCDTPDTGDSVYKSEYERLEDVIDSIDDVPPNCESFDYSRVGSTNWQAAAVSGIHELFIVLNWDCVGYDWGIFTQPLYFQLPINAMHPLGSGITQIESAAYLHSAFLAFQNWYQQNACNSGGEALEQQLLDYIKDEFEEHGGNVTLTPPNGFNGTITPYSITWAGYGNCN